MRRMSTRFLVLTCSFIYFIMSASASADAVRPFFTGNMMKRNGLTDEQYIQLWSIGRRPQIEPAAAKEWIYRAHRYDNVMAWFQELGKSNNFARLSYALSTNVVFLKDHISTLTTTNSVLEKSIKDLSSKAEFFYDQMTNAETRAEIATNLANKAEQRLNKVKSDIQSKRDEYQAKYDSASAILKPVYKLFVEAMDKILAKFDEDEEDISK